MVSQTGVLLTVYILVISGALEDLAAERKRAKEIGLYYGRWSLYVFFLLEIINQS